MQPDGYYAPKDVMAMTGVSSSALRNYTRDYARHLSTDATTTPRRFTEDDIRLIAYVIDCTKNRGMKHDEVAESLQAGDLASFEWEMPSTPHADVGTQEGASGHLVPVERLQAAQQAAQAILADAQRREGEAVAAEKAAQERIAELERELGKTQGKLEGEAVAVEKAAQGRISELERELGTAQGKLEAVEASRYHAPKWWRALFGGSWIGNP
jgi:DNA-binding transcriptional MerR regulator